MKRSFILIISILVLFIILDRGLSIILKNFDKQVFSGQAVGKMNYFLQAKDSVQLLIFGSSRANHHVANYELNESSFNAGIDGSDMSYVSALVSTLKANGQIVLVHLDPTEIYDPTPGLKDCNSLKNLFHRNEDIRNYLWDHDQKIALILTLFHTYSYNGVFFAILKNYLRPGIDYKKSGGFNPIYLDEQQRIIFSKQLLSFIPDSLTHLKNLVVNPETELYINEIQAKCRSNNSRLVFFTSPTLNACDHQTRLWTVDYFHKKGIEYYDFSKQLSIVDQELWKDMVHLSSKGASIFTSELKEVIMQPVSYGQMSKQE